MAPAACGFCRCVLRSSCPGLAPGVPQDPRYLPSGAKVQYWFANESATQTSPVFGLMDGHHVWQQGVGWVGPLISHRSLRSARGDAVGEGPSGPDELAPAAAPEPGPPTPPVPGPVRPPRAMIRRAAPTT